MFWAILATTLSNIGKVFYKKTTHYNISAGLNDFLGYGFALIAIGIIFIIGKFDILLQSGLDYFLIILSFLAFFIQININQFVFRNEKISSIIPFENLGKVLTILLGVFILGESISGYSLFIFLFTVGIIILNSINFQTLRFSKNILLFCLGQTLVALGSLITGYIILKNSSLDFFIIYILFSFVFVGTLTYCKGEFSGLNNIDTKYHVYRNIGGFAWISWLINILLIGNLGLSLTTTLGFFGIATGLLTSYIVFKDIPKIRDICVTILVIFLITMGYFLK